MFTDKGFDKLEKTFNGIGSDCSAAAVCDAMSIRRSSAIDVLNKLVDLGLMDQADNGRRSWNDVEFSSEGIHLRNRSESVPANRSEEVFPKCSQPEDTNKSFSAPNEINHLQDSESEKEKGSVGVSGVGYTGAGKSILIKNRMEDNKIKIEFAKAMNNRIFGGWLINRLKNERSTTPVEELYIQISTLMLGYSEKGYTEIDAGSEIAVQVLKELGIIDEEGRGYRWCSRREVIIAIDHIKIGCVNGSLYETKIIEHEMPTVEMIDNNGWTWGEFWSDFIPGWKRDIEAVKDTIQIQIDKQKRDYQEGLA